MGRVSVPARRRRHGLELEHALLYACWSELVTVGYARLTMESVAVRASTSEAVLYRRWSNKDQMVLAAFARHREANPIALVDTGALRTDLIAQLTVVGGALAGFFAIAAATAFSGLLADTGLSPAEVRDRVMGDRRSAHGRAIYLRAQERGEIELAHVPVAVLDLPFDLVRHDLLMELRPPKPARIRTIIDDLFLPLLAIHQAERVTAPNTRR